MGLLREEDQTRRADGFDLGTEIAKRTREVLEQFERNPEQQHFLLTIFEVLDARTQVDQDLFDGAWCTWSLLTRPTGIYRRVSE